ncbi:hypothetical protein [Halalkalibacter krulwichiae]|uniref:Uncharacterized protein n=1 Tax=Halalkalibacter krulwichiae TaxID=199441 RepID=A0A1X9MAZ3_9BACI|nr:hypothetical protein [Halalkalibacter krulwichiae]ARK30587.1 hypothetical protein BkAM31D_12520 [Halalkalibacter krulwichiae]
MARYRKKPIIVEAVILSRTITIETPEGSVKGFRGDYLITESDGNQFLCKADQFESEYERIRDGRDVTTFIKRCLWKVKNTSKDFFVKAK